MCQCVHRPPKLVASQGRESGSSTHGRKALGRRGCEGDCFDCPSRVLHCEWQLRGNANAQGARGAFDPDRPRETANNARALLCCSAGVPSCSQKRGRLRPQAIRPSSTMLRPSYPPWAMASGGLSHRVATLLSTSQQLPGSFTPSRVAKRAAEGCDCAVSSEGAATGSWRARTAPRCVLWRRSLYPHPSAEAHPHAHLSCFRTW